MLKTSTGTLYTFQSQTNSKPVQPQPSKNSDEMAALLHNIQIVATGGKVDVKNCLGNYESSLVSTAFFENDMTMRLSGSKSDLIKVLKDETDITSV